jgi:hypothetical protein
MQMAVSLLGYIASLVSTLPPPHTICGPIGQLHTASVMDIGTKMCVDPGGNGAIMNAGGGGGGGGPGPPGGGRSEQLIPAAETVRRSQDDRRQRRWAWHGIKAPLRTEYVLLYASTCCDLNDCSHEQCFTCLSVSGNKSYDSKKPFAFILWCTRKLCWAQ